MGQNGDPTTKNIVLYAGDTFEGEVRLIDQSRNPVDLTGASGKIEVKDPSTGAPVVSADITVTEPAGGTFVWEIAPATTAPIESGRYPYVVQVVLADGSKKTVLKGTVDVRPGVSA